jgi:selenocysteine-specific elongation factor
MSDSHLSAPAEIVVGTAGHIDHGKTSLIRALTGIDTDRLAEEKRRGISIDLGFAHLALPSGGSISFIDVPGHERFIRNMLAGACGIDAVMLIVAADEAVKPQTKEHFEICRLLGVQRGLVVLTKCDLASPQQLAATRAAVEHLGAGSFLTHAPVIRTSILTGEGLEEVVRVLEQLARTKTPRDAGGLARLPLDRSFALKGLGTVVTGTLWSGTLRAGDTVQIQPGLQQARIRGLQVHGKSVPFAIAGQRTAVNLSGIEHSKISRGSVLTHPDYLEPTRMLQASIHWLVEQETPSRREDFLLHIGTSEVTAHVHDLPPAFVELSLAAPVVALPGDRFVLRRPSPAETVGGGCIIDIFPPRRLGRSKTAARLQRLAQTDLAGRLELLVEEKENGRRLPELVRLTGHAPERIREAIEQNSALLLVDSAQRVVSKTWLATRRESLVKWLSKFHAKNPSVPGAPVAQARLGLNNALANFVFAGFAAIRMQGDMVALAQHRVQISTQETESLLRLEKAFRQAAYQPPAPGELLRATALDEKNGRTLLEKLIKQGKLVRLSEDLIFHADILAHMRNSLAHHKGRRFSVPEFKKWTQISRKYAIPLLEYFDRQHITRREGDVRVVL